MSEENLTESDVKEIQKFLESTNSPPTYEEKYNVHTFLHRVATADDTTKVGFLKEEEVGIPRYSVRSLKEFALICETIMGNDIFKEYFEKQSEIITASSLSREGFLVKQATTQTRQIADITKTKKENKSWFKKKDDKEGEQLQV